MLIRPEALAFARSERTIACYLIARIRVWLYAESEYGMHRRG